eukprot:1155616-Pelagomonas_calceolata.AAC.13
MLTARRHARIREACWDCLRFNVAVARKVGIAVQGPGSIVADVKVVDAGLCRCRFLDASGCNQGCNSDLLTTPTSCAC